MSGGPARADTDRVQVAESSISTLFVLLVDALRPDPGHGLADDVRGAIRSTLPPKVRSVLAPLGAPYRRWPDCVVPRPTPGARSVEDALEEVADTSGDTLLGDLAAEGIAEAPEWRTAQRNPRSWLILYAETMRRAWEAVEPRWADAAWQLDREHERVRTVVDHGGVPGLLSELIPEPAAVETQPLRAADDGLVVIPLLAGPEACARYRDADGRVTHIAYPMPGARRAGALAPPEAQLVALVGRRRAKILRALDQPTTAGGVARIVDASPSAATYHLEALEGAGLVLRRREGSRVLVHRTRRGTSLLALFGR